jgi:N-acyl-L-homoserine lactone synthetase
VEISSPKVWECTRLVMSSSLTTQAERSECLSLITDGLVDMAREAGADELISLSPMHLMRVMRGLGYDCSRLGEAYRNEEDNRLYGVIHMPADYSNLRREKVKPIPFPQRAAVSEAGAAEELAEAIA